MLSSFRVGTRVRARHGATLVLRLLLGTVALLLVLYVVIRASAPWRALTVEARTPRDPPDRRTLRVLTYNIAHGRGSGSDNFDGGDRRERTVRLREIQSFIERIDPDVVVLQEVDFNSIWSHGVDHADALGESFPFIAKQTNIDTGLPFLRLHFGNAILSRHPLLCRRIEIPALSAWEDFFAGSKQASACMVDAPTQFLLVMIHLEHRGEKIRVPQAKAILAELADEELPVILAGDFNSRIPNGQSALDHFLATEKFAHRDVGPTFSSTDPKYTIDWILIPKSWRFLEYRIPATTLSDHLPVVAEVITSTSS